MGISSLKGIQMFDRVLLFLMPKKYQPDYSYLRKIPTVRVHFFTLIQITCFVLLWVIQEFKAVSIMFPIMLVVIIGIRKLLEYIFTQYELKVLDDVLPQSKRIERIEMEERRISLAGSVTGLDGVGLHKKSIHDSTGGFSLIKRNVHGSSNFSDDFNMSKDAHILEGKLDGENDNQSFQSDILKMS
jgi:hypothetical protein